MNFILDQYRMGKTERDFLARQLARKQEELAAIESDLETCQEKKKENKLKKDAEGVLKEIENLENKLSEFELIENKANLKLVALDDTLRKVDFQEARGIASKIKINFDAENACSALLFLQRTTSQMGHYCLDEMLSTVFETEFRYDVARTGRNYSYRYFKVDLSEITISEGSPLEFLRKLGENFPVSSTQDISILLQSILDSFCGSLRSGDQVLILIEDWHYGIDSSGFLTWFLEEFWQSLVNRIQCSVLPKYGGVKVITALFSKSKVSAEHLLSCPFCEVDFFNAYKPIEVPLPNWTVKDIETWLMKVQRLDRHESQRKATQIYEESEGRPSTICSLLKERYSA